MIDFRGRCRDLIQETISGQLNRCGVLYGHHCYVRFDSITDLKEISSSYLLSRMLQGGSASDELPVDQFLSDLREFYDELDPSRRRPGEHLLERVTVMVPRKCPRRHYLSFAKSIVTAIPGATDVPFFVTTKRRSSCVYLEIFLCERCYYPKGAELFNVYSSDWYRNPVNGQRCRGDFPGAILVHAKGDVISSYISKFSSKHRILRVRNGAFYALRKRVIKAINRFYEEFNLGDKRLLLPRLDYDKVSKHSKWLRSHAAIYNSYLGKIECHFDAWCRSLILSGFDDVTPELNKWLIAFFRSTNYGLSGRYVFKPSGKVFRWSIDLYQSASRVRSAADLFLRQFQDSLQKKNDEMVF